MSVNSWTTPVNQRYTTEIEVITPKLSEIPSLFGGPNVNSVVELREEIDIPIDVAIYLQGVEEKRDMLEAMGKTQYELTLGMMYQTLLDDVLQNGENHTLMRWGDFGGRTCIVSRSSPGLLMFTFSKDEESMFVRKGVPISKFNLKQ